MEKQKQLFEKIGTSLKDAELSQMFGKACFKINKKAFICFYQEEMVFKLSDKAHSNAMALDGAQLFDPSGKNRPMKEWVQIPFEYHKQWNKFAKEALKYVEEKYK